LERKDVADDREDHWLDATRANSLQGAEGDEPGHGWAGRAERRGDDEDDHPDHQHATAAAEVGEAAPDGHGGGGGDEVSADDPRIELKAAEVACDGGQGGANDGGVHGRE